MTAHYTIQDAHNDITAQFTLFKRTQTDRASRIDFSNRLTERYLAVNDKIPPVTVLDRLATLILQDDASDNKSNKTRTEEYPVLSDNQYRRRTEGRHKGRLTKDGKLKPLTREVPFSLAATVAVDGKNYAYPNRRNLDVIEQMDIEYYGKEAE